MRALWQKHGKPGGKAPGYVDNPCTVGDLKAALAAVAGDAAFAESFCPVHPGPRARGLQAAARARRLVLRPAFPNTASAGRLRFQDVQGRTRITAPVPLDHPRTVQAWNVMT